MQVMYTASGGLQQADDQLDRTASRLAHLPLLIGAPQDEVSLSDEAVALLQVKTDFEVNLGAVKVDDEMEQSALELLGTDYNPSRPRA
ncbi:MAG: hypothetical protein ABSH32_04915 [Bryobacteraceae bacterium]|jgi:flagellar basal body rod protein FlgG